MKDTKQTYIVCMSIISLFILGNTFALGFNHPNNNQTINTEIRDGNQPQLIRKNPLRVQSKPEFCTNATIDGLYYLREIDPQCRWDYGSLLHSQTHETEDTSCDYFIVFNFAEIDTYPPVNQIHNIYYHLWLLRPIPNNPVGGPSDNYDVGYSTNSPEDGDYLRESTLIYTTTDYSEVNNYRLIPTILYPNPEYATLTGDELYHFAVKIYRAFPNLRCSPTQSSFVILNLEDNTTLQNLDRDADTISDYDEVYVYITNPYDADTDDDGATDSEELFASVHGYENSDPNNYTDTTSYRLIVDTGGPYQVLLGEPIIFTGSATGLSVPLNWRWDFGDGSSSTDQTPTHVYSAAGRYTVTLQVTDSLGFSGYDTTVAVVVEHPPVYNRNKNSRNWSLQQAIDEADSGDIIDAEPYFYFENLQINKSLILRGEDRDTTIIDGGGQGNVVTILADQVMLSGFTICNSGSISNGIRLTQSHNSVITNNLIRNNYNGIKLYGSSTTTMAHNIIINNQRDGIVLGNSNDNDIFLNKISENQDLGMNLLGSTDNRFYLNTFILNYNSNVNNYAGFNLWNLSTPLLGNYWSDFDYICEGAVDVDGDGIADSPYMPSIHSPDRDYYPLMSPWTLVNGDLNYDRDVDRNDFQVFVAAFGSHIGDPNYNPEADYDGDGLITLVDYGIWLVYYQNFSR